MKNIKKIFFILVAVIFIKCTSEDKIVDQVVRDTTRGTILRTINANNSYDKEDVTSEFDFALEVQNLSNGTDVTLVDLYISFEDNDPSNGDSSKDEVLLDSFTPEGFGISNNGLPTVSAKIPLSQALSSVGISSTDDISGGDTFSFRFEITLNDGRVFSSSSASGNVSGGSFFRSPFEYTLVVKCIPPTPIPGDYVIKMKDSFGDGWDGAFITVDIDGTSTEYTIASGSSNKVTFTVPPGTTTFEITYTPGSFEGEHSYTITAPNGDIAIEDGPGPSKGEVILSICI